MSAQKVLQGSETETRELLGGTKEITRSLVYKGFLGPLLDFQKKIGFRVLDLGDLRDLENISALRPKPKHSIYIYI